MVVVGWRCVLQLETPYPTFTGCKLKIYRHGRKSPQFLVAVGKTFFGEGEFCPEKAASVARDGLATAKMCR